jgi:hypothetical protein
LGILFNYLYELNQTTEQNKINTLIYGLSSFMNFIDICSSEIINTLV